MAVRYAQDDNGYIVYENTETGKQVKIWDGDLADAIDICENWHSGQSSSCYRLMSYDFSYRNIQRVLNELRTNQKLIDDNDVKTIDEDDYLDLLTTIEDLEGIVKRIDKIS